MDDGEVYWCLIDRYMCGRYDCIFAFKNYILIYSVWYSLRQLKIINFKILNKMIDVNFLIIH